MSEDPFDRIIGGSAAAQSIREFGRRAAGVDAPVLLLGESGTGKGVLARAIHDASKRARGPFVPVNCAAIPEALFESEFFGHVRGAFTGAQYAHKGLFEQAHGGTLFLDEVGELPLTAQAKLLTTIEDHVLRRVGAERLSQVDVRIIAATACDLHKRVGRAAFRRDLYHRLRVLHLTIPPLRARHGDALVLAQLFLRKYSAYYSKPCAMLGDCAAAFLQAHPWPGNVRELAHAIECTVVRTDNDVIDSIIIDHPAADAITCHTAGRYSFAGSRVDELQLIQSALAKCGGNKTRAAAQLGMSRNTLLNKLRSVPK